MKIIKQIGSVALVTSQCKLESIIVQYLFPYLVHSDSSIFVCGLRSDYVGRYVHLTVPGQEPV